MQQEATNKNCQIKKDPVQQFSIYVVLIYANLDLYGLLF